MAREDTTAPTGPAAAAILAAGIGSLALGLIVVLSEASGALLQALNLYNPVGPLSGKSSVAIVAWLVSWVALHVSWKARQLDFDKVATLALIFISLGLLGTFPLFFDLFGK
jgi:hypothetical protein